ncbi:hypothetical protein BP5796_02228 [Coleophoma crateriformis]|uniref:Zn(2)-C6 fungal-type domain-containing protein n=1 Tax=Coleophoma crateriformis TaxID=565419 RepID=A0A3D8SXM4_9HELO|nr:hypothetical protein BP5796_02228 [Coleophoma crateriformis]
MGRKPNALILEFFERGAKLEDASNRYKHTCKSCGEKFPKGRIDSLTNHLVKKCPALDTRSRQKVLLQLNDLPDLADGTRGPNGESQMNRPQVEVNRNWTALETLAEVSRQIDMNEKQDDRTVHNNSAGARSRTSEPPRQDRLELQEQYTLDNPPVSYEQRVQREKKATSQKTATRRDSEATLPPANFNALPTSRSTSPNLAMAAAAAAAAGARFVPNMVDPQLLAEDMNIPMDMSDMTEAKAIAQLSHANATMADPFYNAGHGEQNGWSMLEGANMYPDPDNVNVSVEQPTQTMEHNHAPRAGSFSHIAMNQGMTTEFSAEWGDGQKPNRPKVRGRFTPSRRKEVQEVRKKGACIRCRMLKKPCSDGDPCTTCKNVESARLWKQPCVRTRMADELDMYAAGLHAVLAYHEVNAVKAQVKFGPSPFQVDASHYPETTVYATFKALESQAPVMTGNIDPDLGIANAFSGGPILKILDNDNDDLPLKLEAYMKRMSSIYFDREPSRFMHVVLNTALKLSIEKEDALLKRALDFWSIVHILVDHELHWGISERSDMANAAGQGHDINQRENEKSYSVINLQLGAAAEKKAAQLCRALLSDLERRLLQRASNSSFEVFLVAVILLNCVEKSTWLFKSWEQENFTARWPLDKSPSWYASQGDRVVDQLQMLLKMRNVPPKTQVRESDGILFTEGTEIARGFYDQVQLTHAEVLEKQTQHVFDPANSRCYELRFCSKLLLPWN